MCINSPILININKELIMRTTAKNWKNVIVVGGVRTPNQRYTDNTYLFAITIPQIKKLISKMERASLKFGLKTHSKSRIMIIDRAHNNLKVAEISNCNP